MGYVAMTTHLQRGNDAVSYKSLEKHPATVNTAATASVLPPTEMAFVVPLLGAVASKATKSLIYD